MKLDNQLMSLMKKNIENNVTTMLAGPPGIGKSSVCKQVTEEMGAHYVLVPCNLLADRGDVTGQRIVEYTRSDGSTGFKQVFFPHQKIAEAIEFALEHPDMRVVLVLGEITRAKSDVTSALLSLETERVIGNMELPMNVSMILDGNLTGNVESLDTASTSRFAIYQVMPDAVTYMNHMGDTLHPLIRKVLQDDPDLIYIDPADNQNNAEFSNDPADLDQIDEDTTRQITTPRTISSMNQMLNSLSDDEMTTLVNEQGQQLRRSNTDEISLMYEIIIGHTGETQFSKNLQREIRIYVDTLGNPAAAAGAGAQGNTLSQTAGTPAANALTDVLNDEVFSAAARANGTATFQHAEALIRQWRTAPDMIAGAMLYFMHTGQIPATMPHVVRLLADTLSAAGVPGSFYTDAMGLIRSDMVSPNSTDLFFGTATNNTVLNRLSTMHTTLGTMAAADAD